MEDFVALGYLTDNDLCFRMGQWPLWSSSNVDTKLCAIHHTIYLQADSREPAQMFVILLRHSPDRHLIITQRSGHTTQ